MDWVIVFLLFITLPLWLPFLFCLWLLFMWMIGMPITITLRDKTKQKYRWFKRIA